MVINRSKKIAGAVTSVVVATTAIFFTTQSEQITPQPTLKTQVVTASKVAIRIGLRPIGQPGCLYLVIPKISLNKIACPGDQPLIDTGSVAILTYIKEVTYFAAHRSTHGSPFLKVPSLKPGDEIVVTGDFVKHYRVDESITIPTNDIFVELYKPEYKGKDIIALQTSHPLGLTYRYLVIAVKV